MGLGRVDGAVWSEEALGALDPLWQRLAVVAAITLLVVWSAAVETGALHQDAVDERGSQSDDQTSLQRSARDALANRVRYRGGEMFFGAYGGTPYTYASDVRVTKPGTDFTAHGIDWEGRPFDHPIYYGVRIARWLPMSAVGGMIDFTHSKVYSPLDQEAKLSGTHNGAPVPGSVRLGDLFHKLEFTHGHNMLTGNALLRLPFRTAFLSPYVGIGAGASLPHTEVQIKGDGVRTYEYQYTGPAVQAIAGIELRVPGLSYFVEYKFTFADYLAPLQHRDGGWVGFDLVNQLNRWWSGREPEGGWAATKLVSHQLIGGMGYRTAPAISAAP